MVILKFEVDERLCIKGIRPFIQYHVNKMDNRPSKKI